MVRQFKIIENKEIYDLLLMRKNRLASSLSFKGSKYIPSDFIGIFEIIKNKVKMNSLTFAGELV